METALDRANTAHLITTIKDGITGILESLRWEINDSLTRKMAEDLTKRYFEMLKSLDVVRDYTVCCDETNNSPDRIDMNEIWMDVVVKPKLPGSEFRLSCRFPPDTTQ